MIVTHRPGQFSGEGNMITGRRSLARLRVSEPGEVIELDREQLLALVQTDAELSEILMRAFILRRVELIARGFGDVVADRLDALRRHAARQGVPDPQRPSAHLHRPRSRRRTRRSCSIASTSPRPTCPVLICRGDARAAQSRAISRSPSASASTTPSIRRTCATWSSSAPVRRGWRPRCTAHPRGSTCSCSRPNAPGGQAGSSSRIENYLGFPTGISGQELAGRAYAQAQKFGARDHDREGRDASSPATASRTPCRSTTGSRVPARARRSSRRAPSTGSRRSTTCSQFEGAGVYYGATPMEAQLCVGEEVIVVGGGNSAGQAAVFLAQTAKRVHMLVRADGLADTMSRYLDSPHRGQSRDRPAHADGDRRPRGRTRISSASAGATIATGDVETHDIRHVFVMTGAVPNTGWLDGCVALDDKGFIKTGPDLSPDDLAAPAGRCRGRRICSKRAGRACSRSATCAAATSSAWRPPSAKGRSRSPSSIKCSQQ